MHVRRPSPTFSFTARPTTTPRRSVAGFTGRTESECLAALRRAADRLGESPSKAQYEELGLTPSASTVLRTVGGWNEAKERAGLDTNASTGSRVQPKPDDVDLSDGLEWEELSQDQRWHYKNREWNTRRSLERRRRHRRWIRTIKAERDGCTRCGESDPACLDFHHLDGEPKEMAVNELVLYGYSKAAILAEIDNCVVLCANCHWLEHHSEQAWMDRLDGSFDRGGSGDGQVAKADYWRFESEALAKAERLRAWTYAYKRDRGCAYKRDRGCSECGETEPVCLQFHHVDGDKSAGVGAMIADSDPVERVLAEVENCVVLCANCHRVRHHETGAPPRAAVDQPESDRVL